MKLRKEIVVAVGVAILALDGARAWAQFTSSIEGTVTDSSGAVIPGAAVTATNEEDGTTQNLTTGAAGYYRFLALPATQYSVKVTMPGFKTIVRQHVRLEASQTKTINVTLEVGASEEVVVTASAPLVETAEGRVSGLIDENQVKDLPLIGRNFFSLVVLTPGVTGRATGGGQAYAQSQSDLYSNEYSVNMNANGARTESNNFMVDSATVSSSQRNGVANINPNSESVQEVRVSVNNFSAEYGRNGSVLVNIITKSGSNEWHGSVGSYHTNESLQTKNHFQKLTPNFEHPDFSRTELSWGFGGPLRKDKTFVFVSGDVLRSKVAISRDSSIVTPEFVRFVEQSRPNNISTHIMSTFPASFTPDRSFRTAAQHLGVDCTGSTPISSPIGSIPCNLPVTGVGTWNETSPRNGLQLTARLDHHFSSSDRIYLSLNRTTTDKVGFGEPSVYPGFTAPSPTNSLYVNANYTKFVSPQIVNEFSFSWVRPWGELTNPHPEVPGVSVTGIVGYQTPWGPNEFVQNSFVWRDVITWVRGSHGLKAGASYTREHADNDSAPSHHRAVYGFNSVFDFAADSPATQSQLAIDPRTGSPVDTLTRFHRTQSIAAFVQDEWKATPKLTLNFGLRYEGFLNIYDASGNMTNIDFPTRTGNLRSDLASARMVERKYYLNGGLLSGGQHTLAPRLSFAWDPLGTGKLSIRGGAGRAYERMSNQIWDSEHLNLPGFAVVSASVFDPLVKPVFSLGTNTAPPYGFRYPTNVTGGVNPAGGLTTGRANVIVVDGDIPTMHLDNWFVGVQRAFGPYLVAEADYIGSRGRNMYVRWDINRFNGDLLDGRFDGVLPGFAAINYGQALDESHYHGATFALKVNRGDLRGAVAYTMGKAIDRSSSATPVGIPDAYGDLAQDEGLSDFDIRQKLALSASWKAPSPSAGVAKALLGGWQVSGLMIAQSGTPFSVLCTTGFRPVRDAAGNIIGNSGCDYNADGTNFDRPNVPSFGESKSGLSNDDFINGIFAASDFPAPALGQPGALGRNTFRGPRYFNVDLALIKSFRAARFSGKGADVQLRLEAFNAFDTLNLGNPENNLGSPLFGRSTSALPARILQLSARVAF
jgi:hypothetical protein